MPERKKEGRKEKRRERKREREGKEGEFMKAGTVPDHKQHAF